MSIHARTIRNRSMLFWVGLSMIFSIVGAVLATAVYTVGLFLVVVILESAFCPPLKSIENFGQFDFLLLYFGAFGVVVGLTNGLIPILRFRVWIPVFCIVLLLFVYFDREIGLISKPLFVPCFAFYIISSLFFTLCLIISIAVRKRMEASTPTSGKPAKDP